MEWQRSHGLAGDGVVRLADVAWIPQLPAVVLLEERIRPGSVVSGGEEILLLGKAPLIFVPVSAEQRNQIPERAEVRVTSAEGSWDGHVGEAVPRTTGTFDLLIAAPDGNPVCGEECAAHIPVHERTELWAEVVLVPQTRGPIVPVSAVLTKPDGSAFVTTVDGIEISITVVASQGPLLLVAGVELGTELMVFGDTG